ncbi:hypothetical protein GCM10009593_26440 [Microlunatus antarcticus]|uniref:ANTAR domain-containing protein n=1 Tax=Microlunatus antarcticus TaxID=53388 RepID=A0A7W5JUD8_9ACTN|nr:hypothetical protein [Microlunatus antarcticus]MBB3326458.1 hypothetical protein [Microlunatus antarcticus]
MPAADVDPASPLIEAASLLGVAETTALLVESLHSHAAVHLAVGVLMSRYTMTAHAARTLITQLGRQDDVTDLAAARTLLPDQTDDTPGSTLSTRARRIPQTPPLDLDALASPARVDIALLTGLRHLDIDPGRALALLEDLTRVVPSMLGMSISLEPNEHGGTALDINLVPHTLEAGDVASALRLTGQQLTPGTATVVTFYANLPGAFAEEAAALLATGRVRPDDLDQDPALPTAPVRPGVFGLDDSAAVQHALGVLVERGLSLTQAQAELNDNAHASASTVLPRAAQRPLHATQHPRPTSGPAEHDLG